MSDQQTEPIAPVEEETKTVEEVPKEVPAEKEDAAEEADSQPAAAAEEPKSEEVKPEENETAEEPAEAEIQAEETPAPEPIEIPEGNGELVLVTGATGYLASHIIKQLAESGQFKVRGTVRKIEGNEKLEKLKSLLQENSKYELEFVEADLLQADTWTEAVKGCDYVIHTASPFPIHEPENPSDVIEPAKEGTLSVLKACAAAGTVKRVVITSSIAAVTSGRTLDKNACSEEMWADVEKSTSAYDKSKAIAERAAWDFIKSELPEGSTMELSVVNPGLIVGPPLMNMECTSIEVFKKLMNREYSILPKISFTCSDVRDVALAHMRAMVIKQASGHRHIVCKATVWLKDMANIMSQEFNSQGFNIPTAQAPYVLVWLKSHFDPTIKRILPAVGKMYHFDTKRMSEVLLVEPREVKDSLLEMGHAMINLEIVQKVEKQEKKSRKPTFKKKKEQKDREEGEEKKDEPEKAASTSGSADNAPIAIEDVEVIADDSAPKAEAEEAKTEEAPAAAEEGKAELAEEEKSVDAAATHSEEEVKDEATTSDPESSKKKDKKEKPKKEKKEKKKGGLFSFSFKKSKKPHVEKKADEPEAATEGAAAETAEETHAAEQTAASEETPAATEQAAATEETATDEAPKESEAPAETSAAAEEADAKVEETPVKEDAPAPAEDTPAQEETAAPSAETPAEDKPVVAEETAAAE